MKKTALIIFYAITILTFANCRKKKLSNAEKPSAVAKLKMFEFDDSLEPIEVGEWNDDHSAYIMDLSKITTPSETDSTLVLNDDGTLDVTFLGNYSQILIPIPVTDHEFMENITSCVVTVTSEYDGLKKIVWKMSTDPTNSWGGAGGAGGQGANCIAYQFRDYEDVWDYTDLASYYNGDEYSFTSLMFMPGVRAIAMCNNTTVNPFTFKIEEVYWCK